MQPKERRTLNMTTTVAAALRDLSDSLARLADALNEANSNSLEPRRAVSLMGIKYWPDGTWWQNRRTHTLVSTIRRLTNIVRTRLKNRWG